MNKSFNHKSVFLLNNNSRTKYFAKRSVQCTSYFMEHTNLSLKVKVKAILTISKCQPENTSRYVLEPIFILQTLNAETCLSPGAMSRVAYFILWAHT